MPKPRGPKPERGSTTGRPAASAKSRPPRNAPRRSGVPRAFWIVIGVVVVAGVIGVLVQSNRSKTENAKVVTPKVAMGPDGSVVTGQPSAKVLVEEYGDFQCPVCKEFHGTMNSTLQQLARDGTIRFAFHPLDVIDSHSSGGTESLRAASVALCANDAGQFWSYYDLLYGHQASSENSGFLTDDRLAEFGRQAGISGAALSTFESCVRNHTYEGYVLKYAEVASRSRNVNGTPTIFVNGRQVALADLVTADHSGFDPQKLVQVVQSA